jgi:hypothetical protein
VKNGPVFAAWEETFPLLDHVIARTEEFDTMYRDANGNVKDITHGSGAWTAYLNDISHLVAEYEAVQEIRLYYKRNGIHAAVTNDWNGGIYINGSLAAVLGEDHVWQYSDTLPEDMELPEVISAGNPELERKEAQLAKEFPDLADAKAKFQAMHPEYADTILYACRFKETAAGDNVFLADAAGKEIAILGEGMFQARPELEKENVRLAREIQKAVREENRSDAGGDPGDGR